MSFSDPSNDERADWAEEALETFHRIGQRPDYQKPPPEGEDKQDAISDLICDLMHLAKRDGFDVAYILRCAKGNFGEEVREEAVTHPCKRCGSPTTEGKMFCSRVCYLERSLRSYELESTFPALDDVLAGFLPSQAYVVIRIFFHGDSLKKISESLGLASPSSSARKRNIMLRKLRHPSVAKRLLEIDPPDEWREGLSSLIRAVVGDKK